VYLITFFLGRARTSTEETISVKIQGEEGGTSLEVRGERDYGPWKDVFRPRRTVRRKRVFEIIERIEKTMNPYLAENGLIL